MEKMETMTANKLIRGKSRYKKKNMASEVTKAIKKRATPKVLKEFVLFHSQREDKTKGIVESLDSFVLSRPKRDFQPNQDKLSEWRQKVHDLYTQKRLIDPAYKYADACSACKKVKEPKKIRATKIDD